MNQREAQSFSERYARRMTIAQASMALLTVLAAFGGSPSRPLFYSVVFGLACSYFFRRRAMYDEQRRNEAMEDERDRQMQLKAAGLSRAVLSICVGAAAVALTIEPARSWLLAETLFVPALLVLALITANLFGHVVVARAYRLDRA